MERKRLEEDQPKEADGLNAFKKLSIPGVLLLNSKSQGGKSHAVKYVAYENKNAFDYCISFSQSSFNAENLDYIHPRFKHLRYDPKILRTVLLKRTTQPKPRKPICIIFDDCISDIVEKDKVLKECVTQSTHYDVFVILTTQSINALPTWVRENAFQIILFKMFSEAAITAAYQSYGQDFGNIAEFKEKVNNKLGNYVFAFSDRHGKGEWLFLKCPPNIPNFQLKIQGLTWKEFDRPKKKRKLKKNKK